MSEQSKTSKSQDDDHHPIVKALIGSLVRDKEGCLHLSENRYVQLHAALDKITQANELALVAESLLNVAVNLDQEMKSEEAATHAGLLAKAAADKAIQLNSGMTSTLDRISKNAAQYQKFTARARPMPMKTSEAPTDDDVIKVSDLASKKRKV